MSLSAALADLPHLMSPVALARADTEGKFLVPPHIDLINRELMDVAFGRCERFMANLPFQHGKSLLLSHYFPAWMLLMFPETRIILAAHEERYATNFGSKVKDVIERWGGPLGVRLKEDSQAKGEWVVDRHGGGMVCRGMKGALQGRPADLFIIDDPLKDAEQALSTVTLESQWDWYQTVAFSRLGPKAPIVIVTTRWVKNDLCGKILGEARDSGEKWRVIKIPAIAKENDVLGRKPGEALWPERVPLSRLEMIRKKRGRWFSACWQQEPEDAEGMWFKPKHPDGSWRWPLYTDLGDAYALHQEGGRRRLVVKGDVMIVTTVDLGLEQTLYRRPHRHRHVRPHPLGRGTGARTGEEALPSRGAGAALADVCRRHRPHLVAVETGHPTLANEYRRHPDIPEIRWLTTESKNKLARALHAIMMTENNRLYLPDSDPPWLYDYASEMAGFTGNDDDEDDQVNDTSYFCKLAQELRVVRRRDEQGPEVLDFGKDVYGTREFYA